jgi:hypothetical protein
LFTVGVTSGDSADRFLDVLFVDVEGATLLANLTSGSGYTSFFADEPDATVALGQVMGATYDRTAAVSVLGSTIVSGGPLAVEPGDQWILIYAVEGQPGIEVQYRPRYWVDIGGS